MVVAACDLDAADLRRQGDDSGDRVYGVAQLPPHPDRPVCREGHRMVLPEGELLDLLDGPYCNRDGGDRHLLLRVDPCSQLYVLPQLLHGRDPPFTIAIIATAFLGVSSAGITNRRRGCVSRRRRRRTLHHRRGCHGGCCDGGVVDVCGGEERGVEELGRIRRAVVVEAELVRVVLPPHVEVALGRVRCGRVGPAGDEDGGIGAEAWDEDRCCVGGVVAEAQLAALVLPPRKHPALL